MTPERRGIHKQKLATNLGPCSGFIADLDLTQPQIHHVGLRSNSSASLWRGCGLLYHLSATS